MKISRKSKLLVDQVFDPGGGGWQRLSKPVPMRHLWHKRFHRMMQYVTSVHFVEIGDYRISELK